jgi:glycosyltransferase involved in cell wall biosynthesis
MHIVILGPAHPLRGGGITTFNERLAQELQVLGHKIEIYSFSVQYPAFLFPGSSQYTSDPPPPNLTIHSKVNSINPLNWIAVGNELKKLKPDLIVVRYWIPFMAPALGTIVAQAGKNNHTKVIAIADNIIPHERRFGDKMLTQYFLKSVDSVVVMSKKVLEDLKLFRPTKAVLTPHPLYDNYGVIVPKEKARATLGFRNDDKILLFFGLIRQYKGLDILIKAMANEQIREEKINLIVAGEFYDDQKQYHDLIAKHDLQDRIKVFAEFIAHDKVNFFFSAADAVVLPYRGGTQSGVTNLAFHFRKPVIITNVGGIAENVKHGETGFIVQPEATSLAKGILEFYKTSGQSLENCIASENEKYDWKTFCNVLLTSVD